jgi:hypothetical protein
VPGRALFCTCTQASELTKQNKAWANSPRCYRVVHRQYRRSRSEGRIVNCYIIARGEGVGADCQLLQYCRRGRRVIAPRFRQPTFCWSGTELSHTCAGRVTYDICIPLHYTNNSRRVCGTLKNSFPVLVMSHWHMITHSKARTTQPNQRGCSEERNRKQQSTHRASAACERRIIRRRWQR